MASDQHLNKLRRLRILQRLAMVSPNPMGEIALLHSLRSDPELSPTIERVRQSLEYLASYDLVFLIGVEGSDWLAAHLTGDGLAWLQSPGDFGLDIYSPQEKPEQIPDHRGKASTVERLPFEVKAWVDQEIVLKQKSYQQIVEALAEQGYIISHSAMGRYGMARRVEAAQYKEKAELTKSLASLFGDDSPAIMQGAMGTALTAVVDAIQGGEYSASKDTLSSLVSTLPRIGKGFRAAEEHRIAKEARRAALEEAADTVEEAVQSRGLDDEFARFLRDKVLKGL